MMCIRLVLQPHLHLRALTGRRADCERAAQGLHPFTHLAQAKIPLVGQAGQRGRVEAQAIIAHSQDDARRQIERHPHAARLSVTGDVMQRLLHDAEDDRLQRLWLGWSGTG